VPASRTAISPARQGRKAGAEGRARRKGSLASFSLSSCPDSREAMGSPCPPTGTLFDLCAESPGRERHGTPATGVRGPFTRRSPRAHWKSCDGPNCDSAPTQARAAGGCNAIGALGGRLLRWPVAHPSLQQACGRAMAARVGHWTMPSRLSSLSSLSSGDSTVATRWRVVRGGKRGSMLAPCSTRRRALDGEVACRFKLMSSEGEAWIVREMMG
jgi:hypothetical protein